MTWAAFKASLEECGIRPNDEICEIEYASDTSYDGDTQLIIERAPNNPLIITIRSVFLG
jgi:hypothetical protein